MDIAATSIALHQVTIQQSAGLAVMEMAMDAASGQADSLVTILSESMKAMELSVQPYLGANIDIQV